MGRALLGTAVGESMITLFAGGALRNAIPTMSVAAESMRLIRSQATGTLLDSNVFINILGVRGQGSGIRVCLRAVIPDP